MRWVALAVVVALGVGAWYVWRRRTTLGGRETVRSETRSDGSRVDYHADGTATVTQGAGRPATRVSVKSPAQLRAERATLYRTTSAFAASR